VILSRRPQHQIVSSSAPTRVFLALNRPVLRMGIRCLLNRENDIRVIGETENGTETIKQVKKLVPDVLILNWNIPDLGGIAVVHALASVLQPGRILVLTLEDESADRVQSALGPSLGGVMPFPEPPNRIVDIVRHLSRYEHIA
jgi:DNA-binding NarL/FixJ family response regulator